MKPFSYDHLCIKCGDNGVTKTWRGSIIHEHATFHENIHENIREHIPEHICVTCQGCGYCWRMATKDAKQERDV